MKRHYEAPALIDSGSFQDQTRGFWGNTFEPFGYFWDF
jgi:hypothetical protein